MQNKDKRSILFCFLLGDGRLSTQGKLTIAHNVKDNDYVAWKTNILSKIAEKEINIRRFDDHLTFSFNWNRLHAWRKFCYKDGRKCLDRILKYIEHPWMAIAIWLADDGWVDNEGRIHIKSKDIIDDMGVFISWWRLNGIELKYLKYPNEYIFKLNRVDSAIVWSNVRETLLEIRSMRNKFSLLEKRYQTKLLQDTRLTPSS